MEAQRRNKSVSDILPEGIMSVTIGVPFVKVPVLSNRIVVVFPISSRIAAFFISMPFEAATPVPTVTARGVARPSEQGQEITRTQIALEKENSKSPVKMSHNIKVMTEIPITMGTKTADILSARRDMGAFEPEAFSTSLIIPDITVSSPTFVAEIVKVPFLFNVPAFTLSWMVLYSGMLSPVRLDWST